MDCLYNQNPWWAAYWAFLSGRLIALYKIPGVCLVVVGETWRQLFVECVLKVTVSDATHVCRDYQICAGLKDGIDKAVHGVPSTASQAFIQSSLTAWARHPWRHVHDYVLRAYRASLTSTYMARAYRAPLISTYKLRDYCASVISTTPHKLE